VVKPANLHSNTYFESRSVATAPINSVMYLGHSVAPRNIIKGVLECVVYNLFKKAGITISSFDDVMIQALQITSGVNNYDKFRLTFRYRLRSATFEQTQTVDTDVAGTYATLVENLRLGIQLALNPLNAPQSINYMFSSISLIGVSSAATPVYSDLLSQIPLDNFKIQMFISSKLKIQNRTNNGENSTSLITNNQNPLEVYSYFQDTGSCNGIDLARQVLSSEASRVPLYTGSASDSGIISTDSAVTQQTILNRPPKAWVMGCKKQSKDVLQPGVIKDSKFTYKRFMLFNNLLALLGPIMVETDSNLLSINYYRIELGFCDMKAIKTLLNDGTESAAQITVGYVLQQTYSFIGKEKKNKLLRRNVIVN
jgi:hypothetical protein